MTALDLPAIRERLAVQSDVDCGWLVELTNEHTCGAGPGSGWGCEPGCGSIPVVEVKGADAEYLAGALCQAEGLARSLLAEHDALTLRVAEVEEKMINLAARRVEVEAVAENLTTALRNVEALAEHLDTLPSGEGAGIARAIRAAAVVPEAS